VRLLRTETLTCHPNKHWSSRLMQKSHMPPHGANRSTSAFCPAPALPKGGA